MKSITIRYFLLLLSLCLFLSCETLDSSAKLNQNTIKAARKKLAHRKRRIIAASDGDDAVYSLKAATKEEMLKGYRKYENPDSCVDSITYCTWSSGFGLFTHNTKVGEIFTLTEGNFSNNKVPEFIAQGTDPLKIVVQWCRENNIEIFWTMRMNDTHDGHDDWYAPYLFPKLKKAQIN